MGIRRVVSDPNSVKDIYRLGRSYGDSKPHDAAYPKLRPGLGDTGLGKIDPRQEKVQDPESRAASLNDVDSKSWLRGAGSTSKMHPHFDAGPSGSRYGRSKKD
jgi:hypothetical protein